MALLTRERIVDAATEIVRSKGHEELSVRGLARGLDVTAPAIYDHVASKDAVLRSVAAKGFEQLRAVSETAGASAIARVRCRCRAYVEFAHGNPELFRLMFMFRPDVIAIDVDNELAAASELFEFGLADIRQAIRDGELVDGDPVQLGLTLWAAVHGVATVSIMAPTLAVTIGDDVVDAMLSGLAPG